MKQENFERRFNQFEEEISQQHRQVSKDTSHIREAIDRVRKKNEENAKKIVEVEQGIDLKMSQKEGMKLWSNFKKYA